jgi:FkbM family methyltransferase
MSALGKDRGEAHREIREALAPQQYSALVEGITEKIYTHFLRPNDVAVDCGANIGDHTFPMARCVGNGGRVYAYEASPVVLPWLKNNVQQSEYAEAITIRGVAISNFEGVATLQVTHKWGSGMSALHLRELTDDLKSKITVIPTEVEVTSLDTDLANIERIAFIKMDIEGAELNAMLGGERLIARSRCPIVFENSRASAAADYVYSREDFYSFFRRNNYKLYDIFGFDYGDDDWHVGNIGYQFFAIPSEKPIYGEIRDLILREVENAGSK